MKVKIPIKTVALMVLTDAMREFVIKCVLMLKATGLPREEALELFAGVLDDTAKAVRISAKEK